MKTTPDTSAFELSSLYEGAVSSEELQEMEERLCSLFSLLLEIDAQGQVND